MKIETKRLTLMPCDSGSIEMMKKQGYDNGPQSLNHIKELSKDPTLYGWGSWLVLRNSDGMIIGDAGFKGAPNSKKEVEVGYGFLESCWHMGYATESVESLVKWALDLLVVEKVVAETRLENSGSIRVLQKVGMEQVEKKGDMVYWELTKQKHQFQSKK
ncbi:GNAT family N-acetyltransferase [Planococcus halocryophilus]|uniref:GNAT family N-acetyltransferase n=1 Tax=Planococcus halocryophilus TaxID=1215089 RepID=A0A1C7DNS2_9BACL|nr:GNAT family N-acetyltransferase [Planococcus halocryophilus]ANU13250.1 GNAT family N-acetyltransferase [Planococcus halocryophilus]